VAVHILLLLISTGAVIIIGFTLWQRRYYSRAYPVIIGIQPRTAIIEKLSQQRTATAVLREGVSTFMSWQKKILVVDDEIDTRLLWRLQFKKDSRYAFFFAVTGEEAQNMLRNVDFDLVVFDLKLPDIQGDELIDRLIAAGKLPRCIVITAYMTQAIRQKLLTLNIPIISKPVDFIELRQTIAHMLLTQEGSHELS